MASASIAEHLPPACFHLLARDDPPGELQEDAVVARTPRTRVADRTGPGRDRAPGSTGPGARIARTSGARSGPTRAAGRAGPRGRVPCGRLPEATGVVVAVRPLETAAPLGEQADHADEMRRLITGDRGEDLASIPRRTTAGPSVQQLQGVGRGLLLQVGVIAQKGQRIRSATAAQASGVRVKSGSSTGVDAGSMSRAALLLVFALGPWQVNRARCPALAIARPSARRGVVRPVRAGPARRRERRLGVSLLAETAST